MKKYYIVGQDFDDGMRWYYIKDYSNQEQPVSYFDYTEDKDEAQCFDTDDEARTVLEEVSNYQDVCVSNGGDDFAPVESWKVAYYDKNSGAFYDGETDKYMFDYDGIEPVPGDLEESISILKNQGYRVVLNESTQLDEAINNPDEPASKKQLWALFCITKQDWRDKGLTKGEASELIQKYSGERPAKSSGKSLDAKICEHIETVLKPKLDKKMAAAFDNQSVVGDADMEGNLIPGRKRYKFFGGGCGYAWVKYDKRNKKLGEVIDKYLDIYKDKYWDKYCQEYIRKFKEKEMGAVLSQDLDVQYTIKQAALDFAESIGINIGKAYVDGRLD